MKINELKFVIALIFSIVIIINLLLSFYFFVPTQNGFEVEITSQDYYQDNNSSYIFSFTITSLYEFPSNFNYLCLLSNSSKEYDSFQNFFTIKNSDDYYVTITLEDVQPNSNLICYIQDYKSNEKIIKYRL